MRGRLRVGERLLSLQPLQERGWDVDYSNKSVHTLTYFSVLYDMQYMYIYLQLEWLQSHLPSPRRRHLIALSMETYKVKDLGQYSALHATTTKQARN